MKLHLSYSYLNFSSTEITGLNNKEYKAELARVIHNMHTTHKRHENKRQREANSRREADNCEEDGA